MAVADNVEVLRTARGDPALVALATVDLLHADLPAADRAALRDALTAAAVPHWCTAEILARLLVDPQAGSSWARIRELPVLEPFPARGADAADVHRSARLALRRHLRATDPERFRALSTAAVAVFADAGSVSWRIEWLYHLLVADPERGSDALADLELSLSAPSGAEGRTALATVLEELDGEGLLSGRARVQGRLSVLHCRPRTDETAGAAQADELLRAAEELDDRHLVAEAGLLVGDLAWRRDEPASADRAFDGCLRTVTDLLADDRDDLRALRALAAVQCRLGERARQRGELTAARAAFGQELRAAERLAAGRPADADRRHAVADVLRRIGGAAGQDGDPDAAELALGRSLNILRGLADADPTRTSWQSDIVAVQLALGTLASGRGDPIAAEAAIGQGLAAARRLVAVDPTDTRWQSQLAAAYQALGEEAGRRAEHRAADAALAEAEAIRRRLADLDQAVPARPGRPVPTRPAVRSGGSGGSGGSGPRRLVGAATMTRSWPGADYLVIDGELTLVGLEEAEQLSPAAVVTVDLAEVGRRHDTARSAPTALLLLGVGLVVVAAVAVVGLTAGWLSAGYTLPLVVLIGGLVPLGIYVQVMRAAVTGRSAVDRKGRRRPGG